MEKMRSKQKAIANAQSIVVVGGGPVGVEFAGMFLINIITFMVQLYNILYVLLLIYYTVL